MKMFVLNKCCGCVDLRRGVLIIFYYLIFSNIYETIKSVSPTTTPNPIYDEKPVSNSTTVLRVIVFIAASVSCGIGLYGLHTNKDRKFLKPWMGIYSAALVCIVLVSFASTFDDDFDGVLFTVDILAAFLVGYFWICVYSLYVYMEETPVYINEKPPVNEIQEV